jgi:hypothetical protein
MRRSHKGSAGSSQWVALGLIPDSELSRPGGKTRSRTESSRTGSFDTSQHVGYGAGALEFQGSRPSSNLSDQQESEGQTGWDFMLGTRSIAPPWGFCS